MLLEERRDCSRGDSRQMVQAPCQLHLPDQLSPGKCALGWKGARERSDGKPGIQISSVLILQLQMTAVFMDVDRK